MKVAGQFHEYLLVAGTPSVSRKKTDMEQETVRCLINIFTVSL
jgi:hypothetical protein